MPKVRRAGQETPMAVAVRRQDEERREIALEELSSLVGEELGVSDWLLVDQDRIDRFADATGDHQWIHCDVTRATAELGSPIAHGFLTLSLIPMLADQVMTITGVKRGINYGCNRVRFTNMVRVGKRVRLRQTLKACDKRAGGWQVVFECTIEIEGEGRAACMAETVAIYYG
jgi:acyl dehydratase